MQTKLKDFTVHELTRLVEARSELIKDLQAEINIFTLHWFRDVFGDGFGDGCCIRDTKQGSDDYGKCYEYVMHFLVLFENVCIC